MVRFLPTQLKNKINKMGNKIKASDLYDWMDEHEEDPIVDGPIMLSDKDEMEFMNRLDRDLLDLDEEDDFWSVGIGGGRFDSDQESYLVNKFVKFLNDKGYENDFLD